MITLRFIRRLPIRAKLIIIIMATSITVLLLAAAAFSVQDYYRVRRAMVRDISALGRLLADRSTAALTFDDSGLARENLAALKGIPSVLAGGVFDERGGLVASYKKGGATKTPPGGLETGSHRFEDGRLVVSQPVLLEGKPIGSVYISASLVELNALFRQSLVSAFGILALGSVVAYVLSSMFQRVVSEPISRLTGTAQLIASGTDFSLRAEKLSEDELGVLVDAFNGMLAQIQDRDRGLKEANESLESQVRLRTSELVVANERLGAIFHTADVGIVLLRDRVIQQCNPRLEEMFGYAPGELVGQPTRVWYLDEASYDNVGEDIFAQIRRGEPHRCELQLRRKDGSSFWGRMFGRALDPADPEKGRVCVIDDITAEREHAETLKRAMEAAEAADRLKSAFLATMSHELRTPLNSIIGFTGILLQGLVGALNDEQKKQLGMVRGSANHLLDLINDVLDISKIEAGQLQISAEPFDLRASIEKMAQTTRPLAERKGLGLSVQVAEDLAAIDSDRRRVEQVLLNLLSNAIKFTEQGSVSVDCRKSGGEAVIHIRDTGIGISAEGLNSLFRPFSQIDTGLTRKYEGTGLGLSISKRLVELLGGRIWVESQPGSGSTFSFALPLKGDS